MNGQNQPKDQINQIPINNINNSTQNKTEESNLNIIKEKNETLSKKSLNTNESNPQKKTSKTITESSKLKPKQKNPKIKQKINPPKSTTSPLNLTINLNNLMLNNINKLTNTFFDKFQSFNETQKKYDLEKIYSSLHLSDDSYNFMQRTEFDVYKRQTKEEKLNNLIEQNKIKINEEQRIKAFNRLIQDANRRIEAKTNMEDLKNKLEENMFCIPEMKYNYTEWKDIYEKRFGSYQKKLQLKNEKERQLNMLQKKQNEYDIIHLCPQKKASMGHIIKAAQKMYDEANKRKIKMEQKLKIKNCTNPPKLNINTKKLQNYKISINHDYYKYDNKCLDKNKEIIFNSKKDNLINCFLLSRLANNENNKTLNNKKLKISKSSSKLSTKKTKENDTSEIESNNITLTRKNRKNNYSITEYNRCSYEEYKNHNIAINALIDYENSVLEKERNELLRMTEMKKNNGLNDKKGNKINEKNENNDNKNEEENGNNNAEKNDNNENNNQNAIDDKNNNLNGSEIETNKIIEEFFYRQLNIH